MGAVAPCGTSESQLGTASPVELGPADSLEFITLDGLPSEAAEREDFRVLAGEPPD